METYHLLETYHLHSMDTHRDQQLSQKRCPAHLQDEAEVGGESLHTVEAGDQSDGQEAFLVHLPPQEEVPLQVVQAEVVLAGTRRTGTRG